MSILLKVMSAFAFVAWAIFTGLLRLFFGNSALVRYLDQEVTQNVRELKALNAEQARTMACLPMTDQVLFYTHVKDGPYPHGRTATANYNFWRESRPEPYADLYRKLQYSTKEAEADMKKQSMPKYFRKEVLELLYT